jgi:hypothetical protein
MAPVVLLLDVRQYHLDHQLITDAFGVLSC